MLAALTVAALLSVSPTSLTGTISDRTTGQPLPGIRITLTPSVPPMRAITDANGRFTLSIRPGAYVLHFSSRDVPPQQEAIRVRGKRQSIRIAACSTTLDYSCDQTLPGGG